MLNADKTLESALVSGIIVSNDQKSFEIFYMHFYNRIYLFLLRKVRNQEIALELTNDTFYKIHQNKHKIDPEGNFMGYFYTIALNELRQLLRKRRDIVLEDDTLEFISNNQTKDEYIQFENSIETKRLVESAIGNLSADEQHLIKLRFYEEMSLQTISENLLLPIGTIKSKISRTITKLRNIIATKEELTVYK